MNAVWILVALVNNGHFGNTMVPTLEFKTQQSCQAAIQAFTEEADKDRTVWAKMRCIRIEK